MQWSELKKLIDDAIGEAGFDDAFIDYIDMNGTQAAPVEVFANVNEGSEDELEIAVF